MKIYGIVAEYNPFHNGHKFQIDEIRKKAGDCAIVSVMSGNYVQRAETAVMSKYARAKAAGGPRNCSACRAVPRATP